MGCCAHSIGLKCPLSCALLLYVFVEIKYTVFCKSLITLYVTSYIYIYIYIYINKKKQM